MLKYKNKFNILLVSLLSTSLLLSPVAEASSYVVQKGDSLIKIAKKHKVTVAQLKEWNDLEEDVVYLKQKLVVANPAPQKTSKNTQVKSTTVKPTVAKSTTVKPTAAKSTTVKQATQVETSKSLTSSTSSDNEIISHTVMKGESLSVIANKYKVNVEHIKQLNNLTSDLIFAGQILKVSTKLEVLEAQKVMTSSIVAPNEVQEDVIHLSMADIDLHIAKQLAQEKAIKGAPSSKGQDVYNKVIGLVPSLMDAPYLFGGNSPTTGFDCSGFVHYVYTTAGVAIARESSEYHFAKTTTTVIEPIPGDVIFFKNTYKAGVSHMGIYLGEGLFVHAGSDGIELSKLEYKYWKERFVAFKRFNQLVES